MDGWPDGAVGAGQPRPFSRPRPTAHAHHPCPTRPSPSFSPCSACSEDPSFKQPGTRFWGANGEKVHFVIGVIGQHDGEQTPEA